MHPALVLFLIVIGIQTTAGFTIKNELDYDVGVYKVKRDGKSFKQTVGRSGGKKACAHADDGCHDTGKGESTEEIHLYWIYCCSESNPKNYFNGPRTALFRLNYINMSDKLNGGVKVTVFKESKEESSHIVGKFDFIPQTLHNG